MRRLARNAGTVFAADMVYHTNHEVAQCCYGHIWRKRLISCSEFEDFLFLIRILESSLDRQVSVASFIRRDQVFIDVLTCFLLSVRF